MKDWTTSLSSLKYLTGSSGLLTLFGASSKKLSIICSIAVFFSVRLIDFNLAPVVTFTQDELLYTEGHPPSFLPNSGVTVTDANDVNMTG